MMTRTKTFYCDESGAISVQMMFFIVVFFVMGGLAVDVTNAHRERVLMQATADAAAFAAVRELDANDGDNAGQIIDKAEAEAVANKYVKLNMPSSGYGDLPDNAVYTVGKWDRVTRTFQADTKPYNAVKVYLERSKTKGNPVETFFLNFVGRTSWEMGATAVALYQKGGQSCVGIVAETYVQMGQDVNIKDGVCVFGRDRVQFGQDPYLSVNASVGTAVDPIFLELGQDPVILGDVFSDPDIHATRALNVVSMIDGWEADFLAGKPGPLGYTVKIVNSLPSVLTSQTAYIVNGGVQFGQDYTLTDVMIAARGRIQFGQDSSVINTQNCKTDNAIGLFATDFIQFGQDVNISGVDLIAGTYVQLGQDVNKNMPPSMANIEAGSYIDIGQDPHFESCKPLQIGPGGSVAMSGLVQ